MAEVIDLNKICGIPFSFIVGDAVAFSTFLLSAQYNLQNFYLGFSASKEKLHALLCFLPYFQIPSILYLASEYSQFWKEYVACFMFGVGMLITNMTGNLNLKSSAKVKYNPIYLDPFIFVAILYMDYNRLMEPKVLAVAYVLLVI